MLNHDQIEALMFYVDPTTRNTIGTAKEQPYNAAGQFIAFGPRVTVDGFLTNLLVAAPFLYQQLTLQVKALDGLIDAIEKSPPNEHAEHLLTALRQMKKGCELTQRVAQEGIETVAAAIDAQTKLSDNVVPFRRKD